MESSLLFCGGEGKRGEDEEGSRGSGSLLGSDEVGKDYVLLAC